MHRGMRCSALPLGSGAGTGTAMGGAGSVSGRGSMGEAAVTWEVRALVMPIAAVRPDDCQIDANDAAVGMQLQNGLRV